jgi:hypothetical protein
VPAEVKMRGDLMEYLAKQFTAGSTPESRTLSTIRHQLREAFRQCP